MVRIEELEGPQGPHEVGGPRAYSRGEIWGGRLLGAGFLLAALLLAHYFYINWGHLGTLS